MDKIVSYDQVQDMIRQIRSLKSGFVTNFYWDDNKHPYWIANGGLTYDRKADSISLFHHGDGFTNFYYIATNIERALKHFEELEIEMSVVADVVLKGNDQDSINSFVVHGFEKYKQLVRMTHAGLMPVEDWGVEQTVQLATKDDIELLSKELLLGFDPLAEQLPSKQELSDYIEKGEILLVKDKNNICGFIIFEIVGVTWYLKYWYTLPDYRDLGIGAKLLKASLIKGKDSKRQILWVMTHNDNAIKRYEHYGFTKELLNDYVLIKR